MVARPELHVEVEREHPLEQTFLGVVTYPVLVEIDIRWHYGDSGRALEILEQAYLDARAQIEVTLKPNTDAEEEKS